MITDEGPSEYVLSVQLGEEGGRSATYDEKVMKSKCKTHIVGVVNQRFLHVFCLRALRGSFY